MILLLYDIIIIWYYYYMILYDTGLLGLWRSTKKLAFVELP